NKKVPTGEIEIQVSAMEVLNECETPPFPVMEGKSRDAGETAEEIRLQYRYVDLRRERMSRNLRLRHQVVNAIREHMNAEGYWEIETPILYKSTPEGARDFLVPSRKQPGTFYALPQSPQQFKQMLQTAGVEKYYQIARCFRDEDARGDRQPEFTQLDVEASFVDESDIMGLLERVVARVMKEVKGIELSLPLPRMAYAEAMLKYGKDAPDLRFGLEIVELSAIAKGCGFSVFEKALEKKYGCVRGLVVAGAKDFSRKRVTDLEERLKSQFPKVGGLPWFKVEKGVPTGGMSKFIAEKGAEWIKALGAKEGDICFFGADEEDTVCSALGALRVWLGQELGLIPADTFNFCWIVDFPMFEYSEEDNRWVARHHPFTSPKPEHLDILESDPRSVGARAYDLVLNGSEIAGGSIRMHRPKVQQRVFKALGIADEDAQALFGHLLHALSLGTPPHGGIAMGLDRFVMILAGEQTIREVIAFPKTLQARCLLTGAPAEVEQKQLDELGLKIAPPKKP
ncbi:MAG: aspartate--tRNA ligase, partial [Planctomycetota bacterium]